MRRKPIFVCEVVFGALFILYYIYLLRVQTGLDFVFLWALAGEIFFLKGVASLVFEKRGRKGKKGKRRLPKSLSALFDVAFSVYIGTVLIFFGFVGASATEKAPDGCECVMVLGAAVIYDEPSGMLQSRIDAAADYLLRNPDADVICTGGRSEEDLLSESECIARALRDRGIDESRIFTEESSSTTVENIRFSLDYLKNYSSAVIVTNGFHVFRGKFIARTTAGIKTYGLSSSGISMLTPHYAMREFFAFAVDLVRGNYGKR